MSFDFLRKNLLSNQEWLEKISKIRCINICDKYEAEIFARRMYDYSTCHGIVHKDTGNLCHHAFFLLAQGRNTRRMFDEHMKIEPESLHDGQYDEEQRHYIEPVYGYGTNGRRHACNGEILPRDVPAQPGNDVHRGNVQEKRVGEVGRGADAGWKCDGEATRKIIAVRMNKRHGIPQTGDEIPRKRHCDDNMTRKQRGGHAMRKIPVCYAGPPG